MSMVVFLIDRALIPFTDFLTSNYTGLFFIKDFFLLGLVITFYILCYGNFTNSLSRTSPFIWSVYFLLQASCSLLETSKQGFSKLISQPLTLESKSISKIREEFYTFCKGQFPKVTNLRMEAGSPGDSLQHFQSFFQPTPSPNRIFILSWSVFPLFPLKFFKYKF